MSERTLIDVVDEGSAEPPLDCHDGVGLKAAQLLCRRLAREALRVIA